VSRASSGSTASSFGQSPGQQFRIEPSFSGCWWGKRQGTDSGMGFLCSRLIPAGAGAISVAGQPSGQLTTKQGSGRTTSTIAAGSNG